MSKAMSEAMTGGIDRNGNPRPGYPSKCHPDKLAFQKGLCSICYRKDYEQNQNQKPKRSRGTIDSRRVADLSGLTRKQTRTVIDAVARAMRDAILRRERIEIEGIGSFVCWQRKPKHHPCIHFKTPTVAPARTGIRFKPAPQILASLNPDQYEPRT